MSWFSKITGQDSRRRTTQGVVRQMDSAMADEQSGAGWQNAFNQTAGAQLADALPSMRNSMQMTREDAIRRGVSTGDYGTSAEGDLVSSWGRNIGNSFAGQAAGMYNQSRGRYMDLLSGKLGYAMNDENTNRNFLSGIAGGVMRGATQMFGARGGGGGGSSLAGY